MFLPLTKFVFYPESHFPPLFEKLLVWLFCFLLKGKSKSYCFDQDVAYYAHRALAACNSVLYQSLGLRVQEV